MIETPHVSLDHLILSLQPINVVAKALILLNNCVFLGDVEVVRYIISEGGLTRVLRHCLSSDYDCRYQSLWVVGNMSVGDSEVKNRTTNCLERVAHIVAKV